MPRFKIEVQGKIFTVEAPNKEALPEIVDTITSPENASAIAQFSTATPPAFGTKATQTPAQATEQKIAGRQDMLSGLLQKLPQQGLGERIAKSPLTGLSVVGGALQRGEAAIANPLLEIQKQRAETGTRSLKDIMAGGLGGPAKDIEPIRNIVESIKKGLTGERLGVLSDVPRKAGFGEPASIFIGLGSAAGISNIFTKGAVVKSGNKAAGFLKNRLKFKFQGKDFTIKQSRKAAEGLDELSKGLSNTYDDLYSKIGKRRVNQGAFIEIIDDMPDNVVSAINKSKLVVKGVDGLPSPTIENIKVIKNIANKSIPKNVLSGGQDANIFQGDIRHSVGRLRALAAEGNPELTALNKRYGVFQDMKKTLKGTLVNKFGVPTSRGIEKIFKPGAERSTRIFFDDFASQWPRGKQIIRDMESFTRRQGAKKFIGGIGRRAATGAAIGAGFGAIGQRELE